MLMRKFNKFIMLLVSFIMITSVAFGQGSTTAGINGKVLGDDNATLPGATVVVVEESTGSMYGTVTDLEGFYRIPNINVGGPYKLTISFVGYENYERTNIYLALGQTLKISAQLSPTTMTLIGAEIVGTRENIFDGNRTGAETVIGREEISTLPTIARDMTDFTRLTPQAIAGDNGSISIAGMNNRYNAISIDGAVNNDVFGLAAQGTNGGQTGGTPISMDAIDQFQVVLAPYDVRQGGFAGASINAVTRRGTNEIDGSAYWLYRNESMAGKTPYAVYEGEEDYERASLDEFKAQTYGLRVGGPIIKNKVFFFLSAEQQRDETPQPFDFANYEGDSDLAAINAFADKLRNDYGYDPGDFLNNTRELHSDKILFRLDFNINEQNKLMIRHHYTKNESIGPGRSSNRSVSFYNNGVLFPSVVNSTAIELKTNMDNSSNNLVVGLTFVRDSRDPMGGNFPALRVYDGAATIYAGSEPYSTANQLDQDIITITDNYNIYKGAHTITIGANIEYSKTYNLFMRKNFGEYRWYSLADFMNEENAVQYERGYSLVDDVTGDGSAAAADFGMVTFGIYGQDEWQVNDDLKLTLGLRLDMPMFLDDPSGVAQFDTTIAKIEAAGYDMEGANSGQMPKTQIMFAPRVGFNWDVNGDEKTQVRGGVGIFTSRMPLVWPGGSYTNNGVTVGGVYVKSSWGYDIEFQPDWEKQYTNKDFGMADAIPSGQMDLFTENFKFPQVLRTSIAVDHKLPWGLIGTVEGIFTKTLNNMLYYNVNQQPSDGTLAGVDNRPHYPTGEKIEPAYTRILLGTNTNEGYSYNLTVQLQKPFDNGLTGSVAYTYGKAMALNDATSSQNSSQWRYMENVNGLNHLDLSYSDFSMGHRVVGFLSYKKGYANNFATGFSLFYDGISGGRYSYVYNDYGNLNGEGENSGNLIWIPANSSEIRFVGDETEQAQQWSDLDAFIEGDDYLKDNRGGYAERNAATLPFQSLFDFKFIQDFYITAGKNKHTLQITFDIFNVANMLNKEWGVRRYVTNTAYQLIKFEGYAESENGEFMPEFSFSTPKGNIWNIDDGGVRSSRWQGQIGVRYIFGRP